MARDYYAEAIEIAEQLNRDGLITDARTLAEAISSGSTGTEILMTLRWHLQHIQELAPRMSPQTLRKIRELQSAIHEALND